MISRELVYKALDSERDYQEALKTTAHSGPHEIAAFLLYTQEYLDKAKTISSTDWSPQCDERTLEVVRKVGALCVACMEAHGAPLRVMPSQEELAKRVS